MFGVNWAISPERSSFFQVSRFHGSEKVEGPARDFSEHLQPPPSARCVRRAYPPQGRQATRHFTEVWSCLSGPQPCRRAGKMPRGSALTRQARSRSKSRARRNRSRNESVSGRGVGGAPAARARRRSSARLGCSSGEWSGSALSCSPVAVPGRISAMPVPRCRPPSSGRRGKAGTPRHPPAPPPLEAAQRTPPLPPRPAATRLSHPRVGGRAPGATWDRRGATPSGNPGWLSRALLSPVEGSPGVHCQREDVRKFVCVH